MLKGVFYSKLLPLDCVLQAELRPLSCTGGNFDLIKIPIVTLIDTLDTLAIIGNYSEFRRVASIVSTQLPSFNLDVNVSLFETTIRVLGGLLSAHLLAIDPKLNIYVSYITLISLLYESFAFFLCVYCCLYSLRNYLLSTMGSFFPCLWT